AMGQTTPPPIAPRNSRRLIFSPCLQAPYRPRLTVRERPVGASICAPKYAGGVDPPLQLAMSERLSPKAPPRNLGPHREPLIIARRGRPTLGLPSVRRLEKLRPDRKVFGSATLATRAVASSGPTPGMQLRRLLVRLERCQAKIIRSKSKICFLRLSSWLPSAATHARTASGTRLSFGSATTRNSSSTPLRPTGAMTPNSAR